MRFRRFNRRSEDGQAMTEFAIVLPIFAFLLFGVIQFVILFNNYVTITDAGRAGARKAAVSRYDSDPESTCKSAVRASAPDLDLSGPRVTCESTWEPAADVTVTTRYPYTIDLIGFVLKSGDLVTVTTERVE